MQHHPDMGGDTISIHAPHEGERQHPPQRIHIIAVISIHAPHEGERPECRAKYPLAQIFQSTLPTRGSDMQMRKLVLTYANFNPRSPRGGATDKPMYNAIMALISIHAPHEGERRIPELDALAADNISIHAPHEGERPKSNR